MQSPNRSVVVNEDDNRKLGVYEQGDLDISPSGIAMFASDANGTMRILKQDDKGNLNVNVASGSVSATIGGTMAVYFDQSEPTVKVKTGSTIAVSFDPGHEIGSIKSINSTVNVQFDPGHELGSIKGINSTIGAYVDTITTTVSVKFNSEPTVIASGKYATTTKPLIVNTDGAIKIYDIVNGTVQVSGITNTIGVYMDTWRQTGAVRVGQVDGTVAVYFSQSNPKVNLGVDIVNCAHTASIASAGGSVSGSTSGVSVSGVQVIAPEANRVIKVYAFSIMSTAAVNLTSKFTNGSGGSPVELWRVAMISPTGGVAGANLAVTPPGYLFATPSGATLCIVNDSASLIHYSVAYFKESA